MDFHLTKKIPERETDIPQPLPLSSSQPKNPKSISNGTLKRHRHDHNPPPHVVAVELTYKECLKNHAASMGGHALDGCGEFMPSPAAIPTDPTSLKCAACGCHRNFHRREPDEFTAHFHHLQLPPLLPQPLRSSASPTSPPSPPLQPQPSSYYSSAPHMLLALRTGSSGPLDDHDHHHHQPNEINPTALVKSEKTGSGRKRVRTKFSQEQKEKMYSFSEQLGWKMSKCDEGLVEKFCNEAGVGKSVLKVWMHNNKNTFGKIRDILNNNNNNNNNHSNGHNGNDNNGGSTTSLSFDTINGTHNTINGNSNNIHHHNSHDNEVGNVHLNVSANGSSSSS